MDLKKIDLDKLQDYAFRPYELATVEMASDQKFINIRCLDNESIVPTVKAIPIDLIKQAKKEIGSLDGRYRLSDYNFEHCPRYVRESEVLEILNKLIESEEP